jgi:hypothetical protein
LTYNPVFLYSRSIKKQSLIIYQHEPEESRQLHGPGRLLPGKYYFPIAKEPYHEKAWYIEFRYFFIYHDSGFCRYGMHLYNCRSYPNTSYTEYFFPLTPNDEAVTGIEGYPPGSSSYDNITIEPE